MNLENTGSSVQDKIYVAVHAIDASQHLKSWLSMFWDAGKIIMTLGDKKNLSLIINISTFLFYYWIFGLIFLYVVFI